ncbi:MAG: TonB-dependent receptor [Bacteroidota bacterium]
MRKLLFLILLPGFFSLSAISPDGSSVIRGRITGRDGNPLAGTTVIISGTFFGTYSSADGAFRFSNLADGQYSLRFSFTGFESQVHHIDLKGEMVLDIVLEEKALMTEEVVIESTRAGTNTPMAFSDIDASVISKKNSGQDLPFLLSLTPSLVETSEAGNGIGYTNLRIRGSDASRINVTIDGIPLNDPESQQVFWVDLPDLASSIDNIQVQRGVGTSSNGAGAFGASVNIQTKVVHNEPFAEINSSAGSFITFKNSLAAGTGLLAERFAFQMRYSDIRSKGYIDRTGSEHQSAYFSGVFRTARSLLKANIIYGKEHTGIGWWGVPGDMLDSDYEINRTFNPAGMYETTPGSFEFYDNESDNYVQTHYQLIHSLRINNYLNLNSAFHYTAGKGYYEEYKEDRDMEEYGLQPVTIGGTEITESDLIRRKWMVNDFYGLVWSLNYRKQKIEATVGGGMNLYNGDHFGRIIWMQYAGNTSKDYQWYFNQGNKGEASIYGKVNYSLSPITSLFTDIHYRYIRYEMSGSDDDLKDISQQHIFHFFNPKAGLFFSLNPNQDAFISLSIANREPTRTDFKEASGDPGATPASETLYDAEAGYTIRSQKYTAGVNLYGMFYKDQLVPTGELSNTGYSIMTNVENSYRIGAELSAGLKPVKFLEWNFSMTLSRNTIVDFIEHYIDYNTADWSEEYKSKSLGNTDIAYSPSVTGSSDMNVKILKNLEMHFISKFVGKQYFDNTMSSERMLEPYFVNNLRIDFEPDVPKIKSAQFQVLINNILNSMYESNAYGGNWYENGTEQTWAYYFPQAGLNFMVRIGLTF